MILVYNSQLDSLQKKYDNTKTNSAYLEQHIQEQNKLNKERVSFFFFFFYFYFII